MLKCSLTIYFRFLLWRLHSQLSKTAWNHHRRRARPHYHHHHLTRMCTCFLFLVPLAHRFHYHSLVDFDFDTEAYLISKIEIFFVFSKYYNLRSYKDLLPFFFLFLASVVFCLKDTLISGHFSTK